jgi:uncharacterized protein (TIGR02145 family)
MKSIYITAALIFVNLLALRAQTIMNIHQSNGTVLQIPLNTIDSITYTINNPGVLATLITLPIGNITGTTATSGGNITNNGGTSVTQRGVVWSTSPNPTTANSQSSDGSGTGNYTSTLTGLSSNTTYYVRAYATNSAGTAYGNQLNFTTTANGQTGITAHTCGATNVHNPSKTYGTMTDQQGNVYKTIVIGTQEWMAENLKTTIYRNGDAIANVTEDAQWGDLTTGAWCYYDNDSQNDCPYGKLYNWLAVVDYRNLCPTGWHVPTDAEWTTLTNFLGGETGGGKLKSTGLQYWVSPNIAATNESGFSGLPGGSRNYFDGHFDDVGYDGYWWSSTEANTSSAGDAWYRDLYYVDSYVSRVSGVWGRGLSVRCLRD